MQRDWDVVSDRRMRSFLIVVSTPILHLFTGVRKRQELAVQGFDEAIISRLSGWRKVERDVICIGPQVKITGDEFAAVARREQALPTGNGHPRSLPIAQRVAITGSQVSTVVLLNHTAEESGYDHYPFNRLDCPGRHRHFQAPSRGPDWDLTCR